MDLIILEFFRAAPTFYQWVFPLNLMVIIGFSISFSTGFAVEICVGRNSRARWIYPLICSVMMVLFEGIAKIGWDERAIFLVLLCWFMEASLLGAAVGFLVRTVWTALRRG